MTHDYKRHGTSTLFAALNTLTGDVIGQCMKRHRHQEFLTFLKAVEKQTPKELDLHLIVDNYATHKHEMVKNWIKRKQKNSLALYSYEFVVVKSCGEVLWITNRKAATPWCLHIGK